MNQSKSHLTPTRVTDKNGKTTTVYKRVLSEDVQGATIPAPSLSTRLPSKAAVVRQLVKRLESPVLSMDFVSARSKKFLKTLTDEQLAVVNEAVGDNFDEFSEHEQYVVLGIFHALTFSRGDTEVIIELLTLRKAFCSKWSVENEPEEQINYLDTFLYGIRDADNRSQKLDLSDEKTNQENIALLRFSYEMEERAPQADYLPTHHYDLDEISGDEAIAYNSEELKSLIRRYSDRVDVLIELALERKTTEPQQLLALLEHEGHPSLTYGVL